MHLDQAEVSQGRQRLRRQRECQHVIVATGEGGLHGRLAPEERLYSRRHWHLGQVHLQRNTGRLGDVPAICEQAVGDVQRRRGPATQQRAEGELRHWRPVMGQQRLGLLGRCLAFPQHQRQRAGRLAQHTTDAQQVAWARTATAQRLACRYAAKHGDGDAQRSPGGVTTDQAHAATVGHAAEAVGIRRQPVRANVRQGQGEGEADCSRAHGGQVTGGHGQRTLAKQQRIADSGKMHPGDQGVGRHRQLLTGGRASRAQSSPIPRATPSPPCAQGAAAK